MFDKLKWRIKTSLARYKAGEGKRLDYLDMLKSLGIILVVLGHSTYVSDNTITWLASFHMPLFFIVSGFLFLQTNSTKNDFKSFVKKRFSGMMIPYFIFSIIYFGVDLYYFFVHPELISAAFILDEGLKALSLNGMSVLWFLPAIFGAEMLLYWVRKKCNWIFQLVIAIAGGLLPVFVKPMIEAFFETHMKPKAVWLKYLLLAILRLAPCLTFLLIGVGVCYLFKRFKLKASMEVVLGILLLILHSAVTFSNGRVDLHFMVFNNVLLYFTAAVSGTLGFLLIFRHIKGNIALTYLGSNSLIIMLTHLDCQVLSNSIRVAAYINKYVTHGKDIIFRINLFGCMLVLELIIIFVINNYLPWMIGKGKKKRVK